MRLGLDPSSLARRPAGPMPVRFPAGRGQSSESAGCHTGCRLPPAPAVGWPGRVKSGRPGWIVRAREARITTRVLAPLSPSHRPSHRRVCVKHEHDVPHTEERRGLPLRTLHHTDSPSARFYGDSRTTATRGGRCRGGSFQRGRFSTPSRPGSAAFPFVAVPPGTGTTAIQEKKAGLGFGGSQAVCDSTRPSALTL